jgi:hypothetical protein
MTMREIVEQVDAYLAVLYQAREILLREEMKGTTGTRRRKKADSEKTRAQSHPTGGEINGERQRSGARLIGPETRAISTVLPQPPSRDNMHSEPKLMVSSVEQKSAGEFVKRVPAVRRSNFNPATPSLRVKPVKQDSRRPTTPLSHPVRSNVVVISAEQVRLERERSIKPVALRPRSLASGATGRSAFEALFSG